MRATLVLFAVVATLGTPPAHADSIPIANAGFESGVLDPWWTIGNIPSGGRESSVVTTDAHTGSYSVRMALDKGGYHISQDFYGVVPTGTEFNLSVWAKMPFAGSQSAKWLTVYINAYDTNDDYIFNESFYQFDALPDWTELSVTLTAPEELARIQIGVHTRHGSGGGPIPLGGPVWIDDFSLTSSFPGGSGGPGGPLPGPGGGGPGTAPPVPEPGTLALLGGALGLALWKRRRTISVTRD